MINIKDRKAHREMEEALRIAWEQGKLKEEFSSMPTVEEFILWAAEKVRKKGPGQMMLTADKEVI